MKSLEQLYEEIKSSEELQKELADCLKDKLRIAEFLEKNGCEASIDEAKAFLEEKGNELQESGELSPEQLEAVSGGTIGASIAIGALSALGVFYAGAGVAIAIGTFSDCK